MRNVVENLQWLASLAPTRLTGTEDERKVHDAIAERMKSFGYTTEFLPFRFPRHIYGSLALHFGLALIAFAAGPSVPRTAATVLLLLALSFFSEAERRQHLLRLIWPQIDSRNLVATMTPEAGAPKRRIVFVAHVDSAFTGILFRPEVIKVVGAPPPKFLPFLQKQLLLPFVTLLGGAAYLMTHARGPMALWPLVLLAIPSAIVAFFNAEIVLRNQPVPGAADNLSGCATQLTLAERWAAKARTSGVEVVFAFTGCEEAGTGGAFHLARAMKTRWKAEETDIFILDTLSNGTLFQLEEGELFRRTIPADLAALVDGAARAADLPVPPPYVIPAGATDALPFLVAGYRAVALTCIDTSCHTPRNYHHPNDTADRVDPVQLEASTRLVSTILERAISL